MKTTVKVEGFQVAKLNVSALEKQITRGAQRVALTKAARVMTAAVKSKAPVGRTGLLKKSIRQKVKTNVRRATVTAWIGPSNNVIGTDPLTGKKIRPAKYGHLVELGTASRGVYGRKGVMMTPGNPPQPFMRPAYESNKDKVTKQYAEMIGPAIEQAAARIHRKLSKKR